MLTSKHTSYIHSRLQRFTSFCFVSSLVIWFLIACYYAGFFVLTNFPDRIEDTSFVIGSNFNKHLIDSVFEFPGFDQVSKEQFDQVLIRKVRPWMMTDGDSYFFVKIKTQPEAYQTLRDRLSDLGDAPTFNHKIPKCLVEGAVPNWWGKMDDKSLILLKDGALLDRKRYIYFWMDNSENVIRAFRGATH